MIPKAAFEAFIKEARRLQRLNAKGDLSDVDLYRGIRRANGRLFYEDINAKVLKTIEVIKVELESFARQFGFTFEYHYYVYQANRRNLGSIRARMSVTFTRERDGKQIGREIYIGPFGTWDQMAVHTKAERDAWKMTSLYTKRRHARWQEVSNFDFPLFLSEVQEDLDRPPNAEEVDDEIPF